jgi:serine/threonine protein kinase
MSLECGLTVGPYQIGDLIGAGGMGEVYRARDLRLGRAVAVKIMRASAMPDEESSRRLMAEARMAASLSHPHITQIYDIGEHQGLPYVVMELVEGVTITPRRMARGVWNS